MAEESQDGFVDQTEPSKRFMEALKLGILLNGAALLSAPAVIKQVPNNETFLVVFIGIYIAGLVLSISGITLYASSDDPRGLYVLIRFAGSGGLLIGTIGVVVEASAFLVKRHIPTPFTWIPVAAIVIPYWIFAARVHRKLYAEGRARQDLFTAAVRATEKSHELLQIVTDLHDKTVKQSNDSEDWNQLNQVVGRLRERIDALEKRSEK